MNISDFDAMINKLDPSKNMEIAARLADKAFDSYDCDKAQITSRDEFEDRITIFFHHLNTYLHRTAPIDENDLHWMLKGEAFKALREMYGEHGFDIALNRSKTGLDGGFYKVLKDMAFHVAEEAYSSVIQSVVATFMQSVFPAEERQAAAREYVRRFGHLLPDNLVEDNGFTISLNLEEFLLNHPKLIKRARDAGRI
jgi:hypothetical protein